MQLYLYEDRADRFEPLCLTRPIFDLRCGMTTLGEKLARYFGMPIAGAFVRPEIEEVVQLTHPDWAINATMPTDVLLVNSRWLPPDEPFSPPDASYVGLVDGEIAYAFVRKENNRIPVDTNLATHLQRLRVDLPSVSAGGRMLAYPWNLVECNADEIRRDFTWLPTQRDLSDRTQPMVSGPLGQLWIAPTARIEPMVVADTTQGPVVIDNGAVVTAFTRLEGPCYVGPKSQVIGAKIRAGTSLGIQCRVGGEVETSIIHGYSNKYHEGFLGHSYIGEWVNLGAGTHNSDLRNDYGEVSVVQAGTPIRTGLSKVGCFIGDHTKTGLGTLMNTGTNVGAFCNLLPAGRLAPKYVPSFVSWWNGALCEAFGFDALLATARIAMSRRGVTLTDEHVALYRCLYNATAGERKRALRDAEQRQLRRSA